MCRCFSFFSVVLFCCEVLFGSAARGDELFDAAPIAILRDGQSIQARLVALSEAGELDLETSTGRRRVQLDELIVWGAYADRGQQPRILLTDGSLLVADVLSMETETVVLVGRLWQEARLPRQLVQAIIFRPPAESLARDQLLVRAISRDRQEDRLLLENGDELSGQLELPLKPEPGAFHPTIIRWSVPGRNEPLKVPIERVVALLLKFSDGSSSPVDPKIEVSFRDGSQVFARQIRRQGNGLEIELATGPRLATEPTAAPAGDPWEAVGMLQPFRSHATYLSDLEPLGYRHIPFLNVRWTYQKDQSVSGGRLRHSGNVFSKGLGMHSSSRLAYDTRGAYRLLQAELAIDGRAGRNGSVVFRVYTQGADGNWARAYESGIVRGGQPLIPMRVDISQAQRVALIVDFADRADQWDHANWINARFLR
jgi:hypothetical protein